MDQERFDNLTRMLASGRSRRTVLGGVLAGLGAGLASVSGLPAQGKKKRKGRVGAEFTCTAANANDPAQGGCGPGECCQSTPAGNNAACVDVISQIAGPEGGICGNADGEGVCRRCPDGTACRIDFVTGDVRCICNPNTCDGCCISNSDNGADDQCIQNGSGEAVNSPNPNFDGAFVCGTGGSQCNFCGDTFFNGCCTASGACSLGTTGNNCGNSGELCEECPAGEECGVDQTCTGAGPCGPATCGGGCCDANGACRNGTTDNACGEGGVACDVCSATEVCVGQECIPDEPVGQCGPGTATPCIEGCCFESSPGVFRCAPGGAKNACGTGGEICKQCGGRKKCSGQGTCKRTRKMMMN